MAGELPTGLSSGSKYIVFGNVNANIKIAPPRYFFSGLKEELNWCREEMRPSIWMMLEYEGDGEFQVDISSW